MGRLAGDSRYYTFAPINAETGQAGGHPFELVSVTTVLDALPKWLQWWGYKLGVQQVHRMATKGIDVTQFSEDELYEECKRLGREEDGITPLTVLEDAGFRGTRAHTAVEQYLRTGKFPDLVPEDELGYLRAFERWWTKYTSKATVEVLYVETTCYSLNHRYSGTVDLVTKCTQGDVTWYEVIDFKTSKYIYESHLLQAVCYKEALLEMGLIPAWARDGRVVCRPVRLAKDGKYEASKTADDNCTIEVFLAIKQTWEWLEVMGAGKKGR